MHSRITHSSLSKLVCAGMACAAFSAVPVFAQPATNPHSGAHAAKTDTKEAELAPSTVLATIDKRAITVEEVDRELARPEMAVFFGSAHRDPEMLSKMRAAVLNSVINRELLLDAARKSNTIDEAALKQEANQFIDAQGGKEQLTKALATHGVTWEKFTQDLTDGVRLKQYVEKDISKGLEISDADAKKIFDENPSRFAMPELVHARHILVKGGEDDAKAKIAIDAIYEKATKPGADFAKLATESSDDQTTKTKGGDLGFFRRGMMVPPFEAAAFALKPGEISKPVKTKFGYHIIKLEERKAQAQPAFSEVSDRVKEFALAEARNKALASKVTELRKTANVEFKVPGLELDPAAEAAQ